MPQLLIDLIGRRFERLLVIGRVPTRAWLCQCDCSKQKIISSGSLRSGATRSCGCLHKEAARARATKHGDARSVLYFTWARIKGRCFNPNDNAYSDYGGRGITVCDRWRDSYEVFAADMGPRPLGASIDRIDNSKGYEPSNCRWADVLTQANNKRTSRVLTFAGRSQTVPQWAAETGLNASTIHRRLGLGWSDERALTTPLVPPRFLQT